MYLRFILHTPLYNEKELFLVVNATFRLRISMNPIFMKHSRISRALMKKHYSFVWMRFSDFEYKWILISWSIHESPTQLQKYTTPFQEYIES